MHLLQRARFRELRQVTADGLGRNGKGRGKRLDGGLALAFDQIEYLRLSFARPHAIPRLFPVAS
jgi:hypothetical protein